MVPKNWTIKPVLKEYIIAVTIAAAAAFFVRACIVEAFLIPTDFMAPTLLPGDHIFVNKLAYQNIIGQWKRSPKTGEVIVFTLPTDAKREYIKRVTAVAGDTVEIKDEKVLVNNTEVRLPNTTNAGVQNLDPVHVTEGTLFVLGDNRQSKGQDSRNWGLLPIESVKGRATVVWFSMENTWHIRWERIFKKVR